MFPDLCQLHRQQDLKVDTGGYGGISDITEVSDTRLLATCTWCEEREVLLVGCQPEWLDDYGGSLRPVVRAAVVPALERALAQLRAWGVQPRPGAQPLAEKPPLALRAYEDGRPDAATACRTGDARFMPAA